MNILLTSLGCKLNQAEVEDLARYAFAAGLGVVQDPAAADWAIVNTCAVTHVAARKCRQAVRGLRRANPTLRIAVTGCYVEAHDPLLASIEGVEMLVPNQDKEQVLQRLLDASGAAGAGGEAPSAEPALYARGGHTRALVKIQDGCDNACTYCFVRIARGAQRSTAPQQVLEEVRRRAAEGYQEVVLTGVHIGAYGRDSAANAPLPAERGWSLARLVRAILAEPATMRLRLSSVEPWDLDDDLLDCFGHPRLCRHVHLPLQSGSDAVLRRMGRTYDTAHLARRVAALRGRVPGVSVTTDVMVGFPGETAAEFAETMAFVEDLALARLHVFTYSPRPGTAAAAMPGQVDPREADVRSRALIALGRRLARRFHEGFVGQTLEVLCEQARPSADGPVWNGLADNYIRVRAPSTRDLANQLVHVRCTAADAVGLRGEIVG
jgi:threonylcarbamoyladenosine tRNA methylthiotransferase MtaB